MSVSQKAIRAYKAANYDRLELSLPRGAKSQLKEISRAAGVSLNRYILEAVEARAGIPLALGEDLPQIAAARAERRGGAEGGASPEQAAADDPEQPGQDDRES